jgi:multiple sugar transport system substrate-binding protein
MKRRFTAIILCLSICFAGSSCGTAQNSGSAEDSSSVITIAARDGSHADIINAVKSEFESENSCIVNVVPMSANEIHDNALKSIDSEATEYDVIMIDDPLMPEYIEKKVLLNLTKLGYTDDEDFVEKSKLLGKDPYPLGATYALPFSGNVQLIFYNDSVLGADADLSNWDSILQICKTAKSNGKNGYAIRGQSGNPIVSDFLPILWAFGGNIFDENNTVILDSPESREALQFYCDLYATGGNYEKDDLVNAITEGSAGIALGWPSWFISGKGSSANIAQIPGKKDASSQVMATGEIGNWLLGITTNSSNPDLSLKLIEYLTSADVQRKALEYGGIPTRKSIFRDKKILAEYPHFDAIYSGTNNSRVRPRTTKWSRIEEVFGAELVKCINGEQSVEETIILSHQAIKALAEE